MAFFVVGFWFAGWDFGGRNWAISSWVNWSSPPCCSFAQFWNDFSAASPSSSLAAEEKVTDFFRFRDFGVSLTAALVEAKRVGKDLSFEIAGRSKVVFLVPVNGLLADAEVTLEFGPPVEGEDAEGVFFSLSPNLFHAGVDEGPGSVNELMPSAIGAAIANSRYYPTKSDRISSAVGEVIFLI